MHLPQSLTSIVAVERMRPGEHVLSKYIWLFKQRSRGLDCSFEDCENEAIHVDACGNNYCLSHFEGEVD